MNLDLWLHQEQLLNSPQDFPECQFFFDIAGYSAGKTNALAISIIDVAIRYQGKFMRCGIFEPTITFFQNTLWPEIKKYLALSGSKGYAFNQKSNILHIGTVEFQVIPMEDPTSIYGYNLSISFVDEMDELAEHKSVEAFKAIQERTRVVLPPLTPDQEYYRGIYDQIQGDPGVSDEIKDRILSLSGRKPYTVCASTAQGYSGLYRIITMLKDNKIPFIHIRGETRQNKALSKKFIENLESLYNENERLAFLEGHFINLSVGKVYGEYAEDAHRKGQKIEITPEDIIHVGQDLNLGFSKAVACVVRHDRVYVVDTFSFKSVGNAPKILRQTYPENRIMWYPDANSKEIMAAYIKEMDDNGIIRRISNVNPPIIERVFIVNKLFKLNRLFLLDKDSTAPLDMALKIRQYDDNGKPSKGKGELAPDHICDAMDYTMFRLVGQIPELRDLWSILSKINKNRRFIDGTANAVKIVETEALEG